MPANSINKTGRPTKFNEDTVQKLESIFKIGGTVEEATSYAGIVRQTYYDEVKRNPSFWTRMESARHYADIVAKNVVIDAIIKDKDLGTAKWWLEKREFKGTAQNNIQVNVTPILGGLTKQEEAEVIDNEAETILFEQDTQE